MHSDPIAPVIFGVTLILSCALLGRFSARRLGQPSVFGELLMGVVIGNLLNYVGYDLVVVLREGTACLDIAKLAIAGYSWNQAAVMVLGPDEGSEFLKLFRGANGGEYLQVAQAVDIFSRYGVIFLLFHVGLDTCVAELRQVGARSLSVAVVGVAAPVLLGFLVAWLFTPNAPHTVHLYLGATMGATSIGLTARALHDIHQTRSNEARVILGAAVMDDVLGLVMLAIVSGVVVTGSVEIPEIARTITLASLFIVSALLAGPYIIKALIFVLCRFDIMESKLFISFIFVMLLSWLANLVGMATIVGAFAAGLLLLDSQFVRCKQMGKDQYPIREMFAPLEAILVPIFFVLMGIQVKLETFLDWKVVTLAAGLLAAAIAGKIVSGFVAGPGLKRLAIGIGMVPRGEVGLVFAAIGKSLGVVDGPTFSAVVLMVVVTTLMTPPLLKLTLGVGPRPKTDDAKPSKLCE